MAFLSSSCREIFSETGCRSSILPGHAEGASLAGHAIYELELLSKGCSSGHIHRHMQCTKGEASGGMCTWRSKGPP
jgi:hypothetical protein